MSFCPLDWKIFVKLHVLGLGLEVDFTFTWDNKNNDNDNDKNNPCLNFLQISLQRSLSLYKKGQSKIEWLLLIQ